MPIHVLPNVPSLTDAEVAEVSREVFWYMENCSLQTMEVEGTPVTRLEPACVISICIRNVASGIDHHQDWPSLGQKWYLVQRSLSLRLLPRYLLPEALVKANRMARSFPGYKHYLHQDMTLRQQDAAGCLCRSKTYFENLLPPQLLHTLPEH